MSGQKALAAWWACCVARERESSVADSQSSETLFGKWGTQSGQVRARTPGQAFFMEHNAKKLDECYSVERVLGKGGFGVVKKAHLKNCEGITRAVKEVPKRDMRITATIRREASMLQKLNHPSVCRIFETFEDDRNIYLVMEFVEGRELFEEMMDAIDSGNHFDEARYAAIMGEGFGALQYLHAHRVVHRDIKPENIMVCKQDQNYKGRPHVKLIDFGLAVATQSSGDYNSRKRDGTPAYLAPEALEQCKFSSASDVWSMGIIIFVMYMGHFPEHAMLHRQVHTVRSDQARSMLQGTLRDDPNKRLSAADAACHPWVRNGFDLTDSQQLGELQKVGESFAEFCQSDKLKRAALTAVALQDTSQQMNALREQFDLIDLDGDGILTKEELVKAFQRAPPTHVTDIRLWAESLFDEIDSDGTGEIEFIQWQAATLRSSTEISDAVMRAAFRTIDVDDTGTINSENLSRLLQLSSAELNSIMIGADTNGDGVIDFEEFKAIFSTLAPRVSSNNR